ncbi:Cell surface glycoprotein 1 [Talaromyces islandicus]|uniref:Cell surface glycoprotein 1 n=1 Tax=Talaromyces islandicus TaxID=28573 RepID=A0A0U1LJJ6_TALIS|nr:Cell surface glycoprotein 1 [Talaromyces islandicus]
MSVTALPRDTAYQVRSLFRSLLRQSSQFSNYNFREYARRRTRDAFREHQEENEQRKIQEFIQTGLKELRMMKRQTTISQFYQLDRLVVEGQETGKQIGNKGDIVRQKDTGSSRSGRQFTENASRSRAADHDIFEGLPIRRWTRQNHTVSQDAQINIPSNTDREPQADHPFRDLPMPKDSHLLAPQSRALLRAARAGYIYLRAPSKDSQATEEKEPTEPDETAPIAKMERSYTARKWSQLPKHVEVPEVEFLAKRRAGLPSLYGAAGVLTASAANASQAMRKAKVKKIDPISGNVTIYDVWIPEGQKVEGEIKDESQVAPAQQDATVTRVIPPPGTVVDGVGVANAEGVVVAPPAAAESPSKRPGPPPPKRKNKSVGGKAQKRVMFAPGEGAEVGEGDSMVIEGEQDEDIEDGEEGEEAVKAEEKTPNEPVPQPSESEPTPMALDQSATPSLPPPTDASISLTHEPTPPSADVISPEKPPLSPEKPSLEKPTLEENPEPQVPSEIPNVEPATNIEQQPQPQSPVRPQSEQLTPPNQPSTAMPSAMDIDKEPVATVDATPNVETEVEAGVSATPVTATKNLAGDEPAATTVAPEPLPPSEPSAPVESAPTTKEEPDIVQTETENTQPEPPAVASTIEEALSQQIASEQTPQPPAVVNTAEEVPSQPLATEPTPQPPATSLPENADPLSNVESSVDNEPKQSDSKVSPHPAPVSEVPEPEQADSTIAAAPEPEPVAAPPPSEPPTADADAATGSEDRREA